MTEPLPPAFNGEVRASLSADGNHSILNIGTELGPVSFGIGTHEIAILQGKLRTVQKAAEAQKAKSNPRPDGGMHLEESAAAIVHQLGVATVPGDDRIAMQFLAGPVPDTFVISREQAQDLIQRLRAQLHD